MTTILPRGPIAHKLVAFERDGEPHLTLVAAVSYDLLPGRAALRPRPEPIAERDAWQRTAQGSRLSAIADLAPNKQQTDVVLFGRAYAPGGSRSEFVARFAVGEIDKSLHVCGPRGQGEEGLLDPRPITDAELSWECTTGGEGTFNPVGIPRGTADPTSPMLVPAGAVYDPSRWTLPMSFGPLPASWSVRRDHLPAGADGWLDPSRSASKRLGSDDDLRFFQIALPDQRLTRPLHWDERIVLDNLLAGEPHFVTNLVGQQLQAGYAPQDKAPHQPLTSITMIPDTLLIDTERRLATVHARATLPAATLVGANLFLWMAGDGKSAEDLLGSVTTTAPDVAQAERFPFQPPTDGSSVAPTPLSAAPSDATETPQGSGSRRLMDDLMTGTVTGEGLAGPALPFTASTPAAPAPSASRAAPTASGAQHPPRAEDKIAVPPPQRVDFSKAVAFAEAATPGIDTFKLHREAEARRKAQPATDAMNAAAQPSEPAPAPRHEPLGTAVELSWFDTPIHVDRAARSPSLETGLEEEEWISRDEPEHDIEDRTRRRAAGLLHDCPVVTELEHAVAHHRRVLREHPGRRPYQVIEGELRWDFSPRQTLRGWLALSQPFDGDPKIAAARNAAQGTLAEGIAEVDDLYSSSVRKLMDSIRAVLQPGTFESFETAVHRHLMDDRAFVRRRVWGDRRLVGRLHAAGGKWPLPVYFPERAGADAPLMQRFRARVLGEVRARQDPLEAAPICMAAIAFGMVVEDHAK